MTATRYAPTFARFDSGGTRNPKRWVSPGSVSVIDSQSGSTLAA